MIKTYLIDTNILIRHLTKDNETKSLIAGQVLEGIKNNKYIGYLSECVICEAVYVLTSKKIYNIPRELIPNGLLPVLTIPNMEVPDLNIFVVALEYFATTNLDFEDCVLVARMERKEFDGIISFDKGLDKFTGKRVEVVV